MKTTLELPDDLMREVKVRAALQDRKLKELIAELLRLGLARQDAGPSSVPRRIEFPLVACAHEARPGQEITPDRVAEILLEDEVPAEREPA